MFVVYILAALAAVCVAVPHDTILLERESNYNLPYGALPSYEELLELYQRQLRKEQEAHIRQQSHHVEGHEEHGPRHYQINLNEPSQEHLKQHHDIHAHSHGYNIHDSDRDILIEFNRLKLLAKEAEHYFRPEFNGHKLRHHELIAYIEQLLKFGAEKDKHEHVLGERRNIYSEARRNNNERDYENYKPIRVPEEIIKQKPRDVPDVESLLRPYEEQKLHIEHKEVRNSNKRRPKLIHLENPHNKMHEVVQAHINPNGGFFVPYRGRPEIQRESQSELSPREVCINCGSHHKQ